MKNKNQVKKARKSQVDQKLNENKFMHPKMKKHSGRISWYMGMDLVAPKKSIDDEIQARINNMAERLRRG